jgi:hypothetical protein
MNLQRLLGLTPLLCLSVLLGCGGGSELGFGQIQGNVTVNSQPAPAGTRLRFHHREDNSTFLTFVKEDGSYHYAPPSGAPLRTGDYRVSVEPITLTTFRDDSGLSISQPIAGAPKSYGKYSDPENSGLEVSLSSGAVEYDIAIESK